MIKSKEDLKDYIQTEEKIYREIGYKGRLHSMITQCEIGKIVQYMRYLRKDEYYSNINRSITGNILQIYYRRKHNKLGWKLGMSIPNNTFEKGLLVYHSQGIIVHRDARCGKFCKIHGNVCIGNDGSENDIKVNTPQIGDRVDIGVGAIIIGGISLADDTKVAAGAIVCKSFDKKGAVLVGVPAIIKH